MMFCNNFVSLVYLSHLGDICNILLHSIHFISQNIRICIDGKKHYINQLQAWKKVLGTLNVTNYLRFTTEV